MVDLTLAKFFDCVVVVVITILLSLVKSNQGFINNLGGSFVLVLLFYFGIKDLALWRLYEIPSAHLNHHLAAGTIATTILIPIAVTAVIRDRTNRALAGERDRW